MSQSTIFLLFSLFLWSCQESEITTAGPVAGDGMENAPVIAGVVETHISLVKAPKPSLWDYFLDRVHAYYAPCEDTSVSIYQINADGSLPERPVATTKLDYAATFSFPKNIIPPSTKVTHLLQVEGCDAVNGGSPMERIITGKNIRQHVNFTTTAISRLRKQNLAVSLTNISMLSIQNLYSELGFHGSVESVEQEVMASPALSEMLVNTFGDVDVKAKLTAAARSPVVTLSFDYIGMPASYFDNVTFYGDIAVNITASEDIEGVEVSDFDANNGIVKNLTGSGNSWTIELEVVQDGEVSLHLPKGKVYNSIGNGNTSDSNTLVIDLAVIPDGKVPVYANYPKNGVLGLTCVNSGETCSEIGGCALLCDRGEDVKFNVTMDPSDNRFSYSTNIGYSTNTTYYVYKGQNGFYYSSGTAEFGSLYYNIINGNNYTFSGVDDILYLQYYSYFDDD